MFTVLACCVFFWGLQYKLSLYYPPQAASHHVPMAKLLSKNEQSRTQEVSAYTQPNLAIKALLAQSNVLPFILFLACAFHMHASAYQVTIKNPPIELQQVLFENFFVRPPPIQST
jgi:hypothetical protein